MTKEKTKSVPILSTVLPMNYEALEYISWFVTDAQNLQNWSSSIFRGGFDTSDPKLADLLAAANKSMSEVEKDLAEIKKYLAAIQPPNID